METKEPEGTETEGKETEDTAPKESAKKRLEDRLDDVVDKFSKTMSDGVKRLESVFEDIKERPEVSKGKIKGFFRSSTGGSVLVIIGVVWLFYAIGLLGNPIFPIILIVIGIYLMQRYKSD
jgi:hypothetical protein